MRRVPRSSWLDHRSLTLPLAAAPVLVGDPASIGVGTVRGVNSYGYIGVTKEYASKFNANTGATLAAAKTATTNTIVN